VAHETRTDYEGEDKNKNTKSFSSDLFEKRYWTSPQGGKPGRNDP
jgi:hypothetical protein